MTFRFPRGNKYRAEPVHVDGIRFASKREAKRYGELQLLLKAGEITDLELQKRIALTVNGVVICHYVADFAYLEPNKAGGLPEQVVEDTKGFRTPEYKLKAKLFEAIFGFPIREV